MVGYTMENKWLHKGRETDVFLQKGGLLIANRMEGVLLPIGRKTAGVLLEGRQLVGTGRENSVSWTCDATMTKSQP